MYTSASYAVSKCTLTRSCVHISREYHTNLLYRAVILVLHITARVEMFLTFRYHGLVMQSFSLR